MAFDYFFNALRSWFKYPIIFGIALYFLLARLKRRRIPHKSSQKTGSAPGSDHAYASQNSFFNSNKALLFSGRTTHTRLLPRVHSFTYPFLITAVPVRNCNSNWFLSINSQMRPWWRRGWLRVEPEDHLERSGEHTLSRKLDSFLKRKGYDPTRYPTVWLITSPRFLRYKSDQASFWYLYSADRQLMTVIIEVNNTFDERHIYLLPEVGNNNATLPELSTTSGARRKFHHIWPKDLHVSPFNSRNGYYSVSVMDLFLQEGSSTLAAESIHITVTLLSSRRRSKLVSRVWSISEPLDPFKLPIYRGILFLGSWLLEGPLIYPRTVFQALILYKRHRLKMYSRPEPNAESIPRHSTAAERYIRSIFLEYLQRIMSTSADAFHLHFEDPTCTTKTSITGGSTNIMTLSTPNAGPKSSVYTLRILTPKFYATAVEQSSVATFLSRSLLPRIAEQRTAALLHTDPETLIGLVEHAAGYEDAVTTTSSNTVAGRTSGLCRTLVWSCLTFVRHVLLINCGEGHKEVDSVEKRGKQHALHANCGCFLDGFVLGNYGAVEQVKYLCAGLATAMRERILGTIGGG